jgi:predicted kinase
MFNVCPNCGAYRADKTVVPVNEGTRTSLWELAKAICPECDHAHAFYRLPLLVVAGASGSGKTEVCRRLAGSMVSVVPLEADILWQPVFDTPNDHYRAFGETWLRMAKNIAQSGRPVVLFGAGLGVPENLEACVERRYVGAIHRLALTASAAALEARLRARPAWRGASEDFIADQIAFNRWFDTTGPTLTPPIDLLDTTSQAVDETVAAVRRWITTKLGPQPTPDGSR